MSLSGPFLFDPRAFWGDEHVRMMTGEQVAAYLRLLSHQWEEGSIPAEAARIAVLLTDGARAYTAEQVEREIWPALEPCFSANGRSTGVRTTGERLMNARLDRERKKWVAKKKQASAAGVASGKARRSKAKRSNERSTDVERKANGRRTISVSSSSSIEEDLSTARAREAGDPDDELGCGESFERFWSAYPNGEGRELAERAWFVAWRQGKLPPLNELLASLGAWKASARWQDRRYIKSAAKWIEAGDWSGAPPGKPSDALAAANPHRLRRSAGDTGEPLPERKRRRNVYVEERKEAAAAERGGSS